jgi:hypothetical protein
MKKKKSIQQLKGGAGILTRETIKASIRGRERCSRVYPERALGNSWMWYLSMMSSSTPPPRCVVAAATERIPTHMVPYGHTKSMS